MEWYDWIAAIGIVLLSIGALSWSLLSFIDVWLGQRRTQEFRRDLLAAIKHSQPSWRQVLEIAATSQVGVTTVFEVSRGLYKDILTGSDHDLEQHRELVESYINKHKESEPFEGLPTETRVHLERLREALSGKEEILEPLTMQIREMVSVYDKDKRVQRRYAFWGFLVGFLGLLLAGYTLIEGRWMEGHGVRGQAQRGVEAVPVEGVPSEVRETNMDQP